MKAEAKIVFFIFVLAAFVLSVMLIVTGPTHAHAAPSTWQPWSGGLSSAPDAVWIYPAYQYVFVRGNDNQLWHRIGFNGYPTELWQPLGGALTSSPAASANPFGPIDVFTRGTDGALWWRRDTSGVGWGPWQSLGGLITSDPDAFEHNGPVFVCARGADNGLWYRGYDGSLWSPWYSEGGVLTAGPGVAYDSNANGIYLFARGADNALWMFAGAGGWQSLGGTLASGPDASYDGTRIAVAALGTDGAVWYRTHTGSTWSGWASLGGQGTSDPSLVGSRGGGVTGVTYAFVRGTDNQLWQTEIP